MSFGNNSTSNDALLKNLYSDENVTNALFTRNKFLAMVPKREDVVGRYFVNPITFASGQGRSASFSTAQTMAGLSGESMVDFLIPLIENHADANVASKLIAQTSSDKGAFLKAVAMVADDQLINFGNDIAVSLYRDSSGARGQIGAVSGSTITLLKTGESLSFEVGMQLDVASSKTAAKRAYGSASHGLYVVAVDYVANTISTGTTPVPGGTLCNVTDATDGCPNAAPNDYLFVTGDKGLKLNGFQDHIPYAGVTSSDSFLGVNRFANPVRLAGNWMDGTAGQTVQSVLEDAIAQVGSVGGELTHAFMSFSKFAQLSKELGAHVRLADVPVTQTVGFQGIEVAGSTGKVICLPDRACPADMIAGVNIDSWELLSLGKAVHIWDEDGKVWLRSPSDSGMEIRFYSLVNLMCKDPRQNINIKVSA